METIARTEGGFDLSPGPTAPGELIRDIWKSRQLVRALARKNFYVRYRRATLGFLWAGILPLVQALAMSLAFSVVLKVRSGNVPYPVFVFSGLLGWNYFSSTLSSASTAIVDSAGLASRIYFPRAVNVLVQVATSLYGFLISVVILFGVILIAGDGITPRIFLLVPAAVLMVWLTSSMALCFSAMHVYLRDLRYAVVAAMSAWFYITPVAYPYERIPDHLRMFVLANPATGIVQLFRAAAIKPSEDVAIAVGFTCIWATVATVLALWLHCRNDRNFADLL